MVKIQNYVLGSKGSYVTASAMFDACRGVPEEFKRTTVEFADFLKNELGGRCPWHEDYLGEFKLVEGQSVFYKASPEIVDENYLMAKMEGTSLKHYSDVFGMSARFPKVRKAHRSKLLTVFCSC